MDSNPGYVLVYHEGVAVDSNGAVMWASSYPAGNRGAPSLDGLVTGSWLGLPILFDSVVVRREVVERIGGFDQQLTSGEDVWFQIKARDLGPFWYLSESLMMREWRTSPRGEEWYIEGSQQLDNLLRKHYGALYRGDYLVTAFAHTGTMAMLRGDRALAFKRYCATLRLRPTRLRTWCPLFEVLLPVPLIARPERHGWARIYPPTNNTAAGEAAAAHV